MCSSGNIVDALLGVMLQQQLAGKEGAARPLTNNTPVKGNGQQAKPTLPPAPPALPQLPKP